jgi:hypothetical protein
MVAEEELPAAGIIFDPAAVQGGNIRLIASVCRNVVSEEML